MSCAVCCKRRILTKPGLEWSLGRISAAIRDRSNSEVGICRIAADSQKLLTRINCAGLDILKCTGERPKSLKASELVCGAKDAR